MYIQFLTNYVDWAYFLVRLVFGLIFIAHGWPKVKNLKTTSQNFEAMGFKPGGFWGTVVALVEAIGGLAIIVGFYAQVAALLLAVNMLVAMFWKISRKQGLVGGFEFDLLLLVVALLLATGGAGIYSLDLMRVG